MKRIFAALALLISGASPSYAALAQIAGSGMNGQIGFGYGTSATTQAATVLGNIPIGSLLVISATTRASSGGQTINSCSDTQGNTYTASAAQAANGNVISRQFWSILTTALVNATDTVTCTYSATSARKGVTLVAFSGADASPVDAASTSANNNSTTISAGPTGTLACPGSGNCEVIVAGTGYDTGSDIFTAEGAGFTTLHNGSADTHTAYQLVTTSAAITYSPSVTAVSRSWAVTLIGYKSAGSGGAVTSHLLSSAGAGK